MNNHIIKISRSQQISMNWSVKYTHGHETIFLPWIISFCQFGYLLYGEKELHYHFSRNKSQNLRDLLSRSLEHFQGDKLSCLGVIAIRFSLVDSEYLRFSCFFKVKNIFQIIRVETFSRIWFRAIFFRIGNIFPKMAMKQGKNKSFSP